MVESRKNRLDNLQMLKQNSGIEGSANQMQELLSQDWEKAIREAKIFQGDDVSKWNVNTTNYLQVLDQINLNAKHKMQVEKVVDDYIYEDPKVNMPIKEFISLVVKEIGALINGRRETYQQEVLTESIQTPAQQIISILKDLQTNYLKEDPDSEKMRQQINYSIERISRKALYEMDTNNFSGVCQTNNVDQQTIKVMERQSTYKKRRSMMVNWISEYSHVNNNLNKEAVFIRSRQEHANSFDDQSNDPSRSATASVKSRKSKSQASIGEIINTTRDIQRAVEVDFDIFKFAEFVPRSLVLPSLAYYLIIEQLNLTLNGKMNIGKFSHFLKAIQRGFIHEVTYHNDLHGSDVMQMCFLQLSTGQLNKSLELNQLDQLSFLTAAACHDFAHDGFNNTFHVNSISKRSIRYNDKSVQENFHSAESLQILHRKRYNFLENCTSDDYISFRQRFIGCILATDMANHTQDLANFKSLLDTKDIKNGENLANLADKSDPKKMYRSQQQVLEICMHASDVSQGCRDFQTAKEWTYLLFEEFFHQGDLEKDLKLQVSYLCDRETTDLVKNQPGFLNFIVIPLQQTLINLMPQLGQNLYSQAKQNVKSWEAYEQNEKDKEIYDIQKKKMKGIQPRGTKIGSRCADSNSSSASENSDFDSEGESANSQL